MAWKLYTDSACTSLFSGTWSLIHRTDLADNPTDIVLYYAEVEDDTGDNGTYKKQAESNPGVDPIILSIVDAATTTGHAANEVTLAASAAGLDTATAGASLSLGATIYSGVTRATPVHARVNNAVTTVGTSTELSIDINATVDTTV